MPLFPLFGTEAAYKSELLGMTAALASEVARLVSMVSRSGLQSGARRQNDAPMDNRLKETCYAGILMRALSIRLALAACMLLVGQAIADAIPGSFDSAGEDRRAIEQLLSTYTRAVSAKDQALFETLLLNRDIPFSDVPSAIKAGGADHGTQNYESFRKEVFQGSAFTQRFQDVHIDQDGPLASVTLVFVNTASRGSSWGWKTLQLLKVNGKWKIASEFYTGHRG